MAKVTVVMAVYNGEAFIRSSVESVLKQTFDDFEFLIVNDTSTDDTLKILEEYQSKDKRIVIYSNEKNRGQTASLNVGLHKAQGKYIARMDADDIAYPQWLELQVDLLEKNSDISVTSCRAAVIDQTSTVLRTLNSPESFSEMILKSLFFSPINHVGSVFRKNDVLELSGYDEQFIITADFDLWMRLIYHGKRFACVPEIGVAVRFHDANITQTAMGEKTIVEMRKIIQKNVNSMSAAHIDEEQTNHLWALVYDGASVPFDQLGSVWELYENIIGSLDPKYTVTSKEREGFLRKNRKTLFIKRVFSLIENKDIVGVRQTSFFYTKNFGWVNPFGVIWGLSFLGYPVLNILPNIYKRMMQLKTKSKLSVV